MVAGNSWTKTIGAPSRLLVVELHAIIGSGVGIAVSVVQPDNSNPVLVRAAGIPPE